MADASKSGAHRCAAAIQNPQDQDAGSQGSAHTTGRDPFSSLLVGLHSSPTTMKPGGYLRRGRSDPLQIQNRCDRSEDRFASMVTLLAVFLGQPARPPREKRDPAGLDGIGRRSGSSYLAHFNISSSKGKRVKNSCPLSVMTMSDSNRTVCSSSGWPAKVSMAKYMLGLISAGYFRE